jgi:hypothetical protein
MKLHFCFMNRTKWTKVYVTYGGKVQVRVCKICNSIDARVLQYASGVDASTLNDAIESISEHPAHSLE